MSEHTELPWEIIWQTKSSFTIGLRDRQLAVAEVIDSHVERHIAEANAEFIVRAVNSHEELLTTCEKAKIAIYDAMHAGNLSREYAGGVIAELEAAIKKAGE